MKNIKFKIFIFTCFFIIIMYIVSLCQFYVKVNFNYVYKSNTNKISDDIYPVWTLLSTEEEFNRFEITERKNLNFDKYNYIACQGGIIVNIKYNINDLFENKKRAYVFVNKSNPYDIYIYEIKKINLIHDLLSAPTTILR